MGLEFLDLEFFTKKLNPVTSAQIFTRTDEFHPHGLFSELIFGVQGSIERKKKFSYINLNSNVIHPTAYKIFIRLDRKLEKMFSTELSFSLDKDQNLVSDDNGVTGIEEFIKLFPKIKFRGETPDREAFIDVLEKAYKKGTLFINKIPVIPPEQRPLFKDETGRYNSDKINDFYLMNLNKAIQIKSFGKKGTMYDLMNWGIQRSVNDLDDYVRTRIGKKYGLIRSSLLGKRADFSGRAVITAGPQLSSTQIGLPFRLALWLFESFIIHNLLKLKGEEKELLEKEVKDFTKTNLSVNSIMIVFRALREGDNVPENLYNIFFEATVKSSEGRVVLAKRDPVLHAESVRAYYPVIIKGDTIQLSTLVVGGFGADFDGDQMAVFHPLTNEAQAEAKKRMMMVRGPSSSSDITFTLSKEMYVGLYLLTKDSKLFRSPIHITKDDLEKAIDPYIPVTFKGHSTTMGRAIFNNCFPKDFKFIGDQVNKKAITKLIAEVLRTYGDDATKEVVLRLKDVGFKFATILAPSLSLDEITVPAEIYKLKKNLDKASTEEAVVIMKKMEEILVKHLKDTGLYSFVESGAGRGWEQPIQILIAKGIMVDPTGKILPPIKGSLSDGLTPTEYFTAAGGARAGIIDRVINTSTTGYTSRKLAFLLNSVELDWLKKDCGTDLTLDIKLDPDISRRLTGRYVIYRNHVEPFDPSKFKTGDLIHLRTPIYCKSPKICHTCYGKLLEAHKSPYVGIIAAQTIGERGTQLIMRTFHSTAIKPIVRDILKDISDNDPLVNLEQIKKKIKSDKNSVFCYEDCLLTISLEDYKIGDDLQIDEEENTVAVNGLISKIEFSDLTFDIILDYPVILKYTDISRTPEELKLSFKKDDEMIEVPFQKQDIKEVTLYLERLISGKVRFKNTDHLFFKLYKSYADISDMDLVHLEVLISQILRDKSNPVIPARVGKDPLHPSLFNIKKNIFNSGLLQGLAFENVNTAINTGLISKTELEPSILEKVLTGTLVKKKSDED